MWWMMVSVVFAQELTGDEWDRRPRTLVEADAIAVGMTVNQTEGASAKGREVAELLPLVGFRSGAVSGQDAVARVVRVCNGLARGLNATADTAVRREAESHGVDAAARRDLAATHAHLRALVPADRRSDLTELLPL